MNSHDPKDPALIARMGADPELKSQTRRWFDLTCQYRYSYNFTWMGRPIIQYPQDIVAMQELIWKVQPELIIETGIAHGGSLVFYASMLELLGGSGRVLGIDIEIRPHNRAALETHKMFKRITLLEGSSIDPQVAAKATEIAKVANRIMVVLDSNHSHDHVMRELQLYTPLVTKGSYVVVFDTVVEDMPAELIGSRPWGKGNNAKTAVREFLKGNDRFVRDSEIDDKLLVTVAPEGYLRCIRDK